MKQMFTSLVLALSIFTLSAQRSHAAIGLGTANSTLVTLGGLASLSSGVTIVSAFNGSDSIATGLAKLFWGIVLGAAGITLLEGSQEAEILFSPITSSPDFSANELSIYNSELLELNSIHQTIAAEIKADPKLEAKDLWSQYSYALSPETLEVAGSTAKKLFASLKK